MTGDKILYEVRYPDGDTARMYARQLSFGENGMALHNGTSSGGTIFFAPLSSGVTISQVAELVPAADTEDRDRSCGCGGTGIHGVDHNED